MSLIVATLGFESFEIHILPQSCNGGLLKIFATTERVYIALRVGVVLDCFDS